MTDAPFRIDREAERQAIDQAMEQHAPDPKRARRLFSNARRLCARQWQRSPNWVIAMELYGVGSTYAYAICRRIDVDPDARTPRPLANIDTLPTTSAGMPALEREG